MFKKGNKRGQLTIFIIVAILIVTSVILVFTLRQKESVSEIPKDFRPVYDSFLSCLEEEISVGVDVLESQGGYIFLPDFEPGSRYMPFSSQLDFLGNPIPYWYYVSGNNLEREQIPKKIEMEEDLAKFIDRNLRKCDLNKYSEEGVLFSLGEPESKVKISDSEISVNVKMELSLEKGEEKFKINSHNFIFNSRLGELYNSALRVYNFEQDELFLEKYTLDILFNYAPVNGVKVECSPQIWNANEIFQTLDKAIEGNILALKVEGGEKDYFVVDGLNLDKNVGVRFINSKNWSRAYNVNPSEENLLLANPIGTQTGMGILGFCYVPYHFVYDIKYPVLVQVGDVYSDKGEVFQFPLAVIIKGNNPRESLEGEVVNSNSSNICEYRNNFVELEILDNKFRGVDANISYECLGSSCFIGESSNGKLKGYFPQCINGFIKARAEGFKDSRTLFSSIEEDSASIFMERVYKKKINLFVDNLGYSGKALINFVSKDNKKSKTVVYPEQKSVELSEGEYEVSVFVYLDSNLKLPASSSRECIEVPSSGIAGFFGATKEKCINVEIPEQLATNVLSGGGKETYYILESDLEKKGPMTIRVEKLPLPKDIVKLQENYILFEEQGVSLIF